MALQSHFTLKTPQQMRALLTHLRGVLISRLIDKPATALELSREMKFPPTKLYYHLHALERHGMIKVVKTERKRNFVEKTYQAVAKNYTVTHDPLKWTKGFKRAYDDALTTILDSTAKLVEKVREKGRDPLPRGKAILSLTGYRLTEKEAKTFGKEMIELMKKYDAKSRPKGEAGVGLTVVMYRE